MPGYDDRDGAGANTPPILELSLVQQMGGPQPPIGFHAVVDTQLGLPVGAGYAGQIISEIPHGIDDHDDGQRRWSHDDLNLDETAYITAPLERMRDFGEALFRELFVTTPPGEDTPTNLWQAYTLIRGERTKYLQLNIRADDALFHIPWEALKPRNGPFLAIDRNSPIIRWHQSGNQRLPDDISGPIKILVVAANPRKDLASDAEIDAIVDAFEAIDSDTGDGIKPFDLRVGSRHVTAPELAELVCDFEPHIVHFIGHGTIGENTGSLSLHDQNDPDAEYQMSAADFAEKFTNNVPWLVILNSCFGAKGAAQKPFSGVGESLILSGVPFVIAMQYAITNTSAITFSKAFYSRLFRGNSLTDALAIARARIVNQNLDQEDPNADNYRVEFLTPVLLSSCRQFDIGYANAASASPLPAAGAPLAEVAQDAGPTPEFAAPPNDPTRGENTPPPPDSPGLIAQFWQDLNTFAKVLGWLIVLTIVCIAGLFAYSVFTPSSSDMAELPSQSFETAGDTKDGGQAVDPTSTPTTSNPGTKEARNDETNASKRFKADETTPEQLDTKDGGSRAPSSVIRYPGARLVPASLNVMMDLPRYYNEPDFAADSKAQVAALQAGLEENENAILDVAITAEAGDFTRGAALAGALVSQALSAGIPAEKMNLSIEYGAALSASAGLTSGSVARVPKEMRRDGKVAAFPLDALTPASLDIKGLTTLGQFAADQNLRVEVIGLADRTASAPYNLALSNARAQWVGSFIKELVPNLTADQMTLHGAGERWSPGPDGAQDAAQRTVIVRLRPPIAALQTYPFDSAALSDKALGDLRPFVDWLSVMPGARITLEGHTDPRGPAAYNQSLGLKRATALRQALEDVGLDPALVTLTSYGESRPAFPIPQPHDELRRTEIIIRPDGDG